jgi:hypothetical protein
MEPRIEQGDKAAIGMRNQDVWCVLARGGEQRPQVVDILVNTMRLCDRRRYVGALNPRPRPVIRADARETGNGWKNGSLALKQAAFARTDGVERGVVDRVGGIKDLAPVGGAVPLAGDKYHRRRAHAATLEIHIAPAADVDQFGEISAFRSMGGRRV